VNINGAAVFKKCYSTKNPFTMTVITAAQFKIMLQNGEAISNVQVNEMIDIQPGDMIAGNMQVNSSILPDIRISGKTIPTINFFMTQIRALMLVQCSIDTLSIGQPGSSFQRIEADPQTSIGTLNISAVDASGGVRLTGSTVRKINVSDCSLQGFYLSLDAARSCEWKATNVNCNQVTFAGNFMFLQGQIST
jgi:hypothetical protein